MSELVENKSSDANETELEPKSDLSWIPEGKEPLADGDYDMIFLGTGLKECILSGTFAVEGKKVLVIDRNNYYGGDCASLNLSQMFKKHRGSDQVPEALGSDRYFYIDQIPKFIMACGDLVKILLTTKVTRYLDLWKLDGSYVFQKGKIHKVPSTPNEALQTPLVGWFEKGRLANFVRYMIAYEPNDPSTHKGYNLKTMTTRELYAKYNLSPSTCTFIGHCMALQTDDTYLDKPALQTVEACKLSMYSVDRYGTSPFLYPHYGLSGLPEGFSRLAAIHNGVFMLDTNIDELLTDEKGSVYGVRSGNGYARAKCIIGDPSYFPPEKKKVVGKVIRTICILDHPLQNTGNAESGQIIIPASEVGRQNDIYVAVLSKGHNVASDGRWIAIASTEVENDGYSEVQPAIQLMQPIMERFDTITETFAPINDPTSDNCFISTSYDATSHFETAVKDILQIYEKISGKPFDLSINADSTEADEY